MRKWIIIGVVIAALLVLLGFVFHQKSEMTEKWKIAVANMKAYDLELSKAKEKNTAYQFTISQLKYFNDSVLQELNATKEELGIKDKNLKALQAVYSKFVKKDTIRITQTDTLFKDPELAIDTIVGDEWYTVRLGLMYPSTVAVQPEFKSQKHIVVSTKRETVNPPKKFFLFRWFQKKHTVLQIDVVEKNPYVNDESSKYIEILK